MAPLICRGQKRHSRKRVRRLGRKLRRPPKFRSRRLPGKHLVQKPPKRKSRNQVTLQVTLQLQRQRNQVPSQNTTRKRLPSPLKPQPPRSRSKPPLPNRPKLPLPECCSRDR